MTTGVTSMTSLAPIQMCKELVALLFGGFRSLDAPYFRCVVVNWLGCRWCAFGSYTRSAGQAGSTRPGKDRVSGNGIELGGRRKEKKNLSSSIPQSLSRDSFHTLRQQPPSFTRPHSKNSPKPIRIINTTTKLVQQPEKPTRRRRRCVPFFFFK